MQWPGKILARIAAAAAVLLLQAAGAGAAPRNGVEDPGFVPPPSGSGGPIVQDGCTVLIDFDEAAQPCFFKQTNPLRNEYQGLGVVFSGPSDLDGGAILDECGNFGVTGYSPPNFLAFNCIATMMNGGIPRGPEVMSLASAAFVVGAGVASGDDQGSTLIMEAYDANQQLIGSASVVLQPAMQLIFIAASGIRSVIFATTGPCIWVLDGLCLNLEATPVEETTWGEIKSVFK